jgi:CubicO group peptidase (beta-lactamase class C family)
MTDRDRLEAVLQAIDGWGAGHAAAAVVGQPGVVATHGDARHVFGWASVTKLLTSGAVLIAAERGLLDLDEPAGPPGATVRHLLAHASGLAFDGPAVLAQPGRRRIYSNPGYDVLGEIVADRTGRPFGEVLSEWVLGPLGMQHTHLVDRPSQGLEGPLADLARFAHELLRPTLVHAATLAEATTVAFPGLSGVVPGVGRYDPCDWGLGFELHDGKAAHWMGQRNSPASYGHFGGTGTFLWIDPDVQTGLIALTDRDFGAWALEAWPRISDEVLAAMGSEFR